MWPIWTINNNKFIFQHFTRKEQIRMFKSKIVGPIYWTEPKFSDWILACTEIHKIICKQIEPKFSLHKMTEPHLNVYNYFKNFELYYNNIVCLNFYCHLLL